MSKNPTFYDTVVSSPQWKLWYEEIMRRHLINEKGGKWEDNKTFDIDESQECGWLGDEHFQEFIKFCCATQQAQMRDKIKKILKDYNDDVISPQEIANRLERLISLLEDISDKEDR